MIRKDLLTGEEFSPKRSSQRFSCPANRIKFHSNRATQLRHDSAYVNKPLLKNFRILNELMKGKLRGTFHKQFLLGKGFNFKVLTHFEEYEEETCNAIYQYIIIPIENNKIKIIRYDRHN